MTCVNISKVCCVLFVINLFLAVQPLLGGDIEVLLQSKEQMLHCNPNVLPSWNNSRPLAKWEGVTVVEGGAASGVVKELQLSGRGLCGPAPASWSQLKGLAGLNIAHNNLTATLPTSWSQLTALTRIASEHNSLLGPLPAEWSKLTQLTWVSLGYNNLNNTLPSAWSELQQLETLGLSGNSLEGSLPQSWGRLSNLKQLLLGGNQLTGSIPSVWVQRPDESANRSNSMLVSSSHEANCMWEALRFVDLSRNLLAGSLPALPAAVVYFVAQGNQFFGELQSIPGSLVYLDLSNNRLQGGVPVVDSTNLVFIRLDNNSFQALPETFHAPNATFVSIANNQLSGGLPDWSSSQLLAYCDLGNNSLSGTLPDSWHEHDWTFLALGGNTFSGPLPTTWRGKVSVLLLQKNGFTGCPPLAWPNSNIGTVISLSHNNFANCNKLPDFSNMFEHLSLLDMAHCNLRSGIPLTWMDAAFNNQTVLNLGELWKTSAQRSRTWRRSVCTSRNLNSRLKNHLHQTYLSENVRGDLQRALDPALAPLSDMIAEFESISSTNLIVSPHRHLSPVFQQPSVEDLCLNKNATLLVTAQWALLIATLVLQVGLYLMELRYKMFSRSLQWLTSKAKDLVANIRAKVKQAILRRSLSNQGQNAAVNQQAGVRSAPASKPRVTIKHIGICMLHMPCLCLYWLDIVTDIKVLEAVWGGWPSYALMVMLLLHYVVAAVVIAWRWPGRQKHWCPTLTLCLITICVAPWMPILDTVSLVILSMPKHWLPMPGLHRVVFRWNECVMRDLIGLVLEAIPTAVLQSVVFVAGNNPNSKLFLDDNLYMLSALVSCARIVRLVAKVLWAATKDPDLTPWQVMLAMMHISSKGQAGDDQLPVAKDVEGAAVVVRQIDGAWPDEGKTAANPC